MTNVLLTAFKPYGPWTSNASWLALVELTKDLPADVRVTTRLYPVDFLQVRDLLARDLAENHDFALHLGQAPGRDRVELEAFALNVAGEPGEAEENFPPLVDDGPPAFSCRWPLREMVARIRAAGVPAGVSHHAGVYLCNAALYLSHYLAQAMSLKTLPGFIHVPLDPTQLVDAPQGHPTLPATESARAVRLALDELLRH